jgi:hypothetical protein
MDRGNHYEAAIEGYLQWHRLGYVAVDEARRATCGDQAVKSLDFIVFGDGGARLLVDVKGRQYPGGPESRRRRTWECWSTQEDLDGLASWEALAGPGYVGLLLFAYHLLPDVALPDRLDDLWTWRGRRYLLRAIPAADYRRHLRVRSPRWGTVTIPRATFRRLVRPFRHFTRGTPVLVPPAPFGVPAGAASG